MICSWCFILSVSGAFAADHWEGWATTTYFGDGEASWPSGSSDALYLSALNDLNNKTHVRFGAAVPWRFYYEWYMSRKGLLETVLHSMSGTRLGDKPCFLAQPITKFPAELRGMTDLDKTSPIPQDCGGNTSCTDINDDAVVAQNLDKSEPLPQYLVIPYEGCGGDGRDAKTCPDIFNTCYMNEAKKDPATAAAVLEGDFTKATDECCKGMQVLCHGDDTPATNATCPWSKDSAELRTKFNKYSATLSMSSETQWGQKFAAGVHVNWCGGLNMHFDLATAPPHLPWNNLTTNIAKVNKAETNIMMRYKRVECNIWGNIEQPTGCDSCDSCVAVPNNPQGAKNTQCAPCARGKQKYWPCNIKDLCTCASRRLADVHV